MKYKHAVSVTSEVQSTATLQVSWCNLNHHVKNYSQNRPKQRAHYDFRSTPSSWKIPRYRVFHNADIWKQVLYQPMIVSVFYYCQTFEENI